MKKTITVVITKTVDVEIKDECLTDEFLDEFENLIYNLDNKTNRIDSLFEHVGRHIAMYDDINFLEGIGKAAGRYAPTSDKDQAMVNYSSFLYDIESEIN